MTVDRNWIDHIDAMDQLRKGISLRAYGQVDPVIAYKKEGFEMFDEMIERIQRQIITLLLKIKVEIRVAPPAQQAAQAKAPAGNAPRTFRRQMPTSLENMSSYNKGGQNQNK